MSRKNKLDIISWAAVAVIAVTIFCFSAQRADLSNESSGFIVGILTALFPGLDTMRLDLLTTIVRKTGHFTEYLLLGLALINAVRRTFSKIGDKAWIAAGVCGYAYAVSDEIHQLFVPGRAGMFTDTLIDLAGVMTGIGLYLLCHVRRKSEEGGDDV